MRLIDIDAINPMKCPQSITEMREWFDELPTAYDIDKVVEQLEETAWEYESFGYEDSKVVDLVDAIEIVKEGGAV